MMGTLVKLNGRYPARMKVSLASGRIVEFSKESPTECLGEGEMNGKEYLFETIGKCSEKATAVRLAKQDKLYRRKCRPKKGVGDHLADLFGFFKIKKCRACSRRQSWLNKNIRWPWRAS